MSEPVAFTPEQVALAESVRRYCRSRCTEDVRRAPATSFPWTFWRDLADLGVLALALPGEDGGAGAIAAAAGELGRAFAPGPVAATFFATHVLPTELALPLASGAGLVSTGRPPLMPWAPLADVVIETGPSTADGEQAWLARPVGPVDPVGTLGGEPWGRVRLERLSPLDRVPHATDLADLALAAYLWGAGRRLLDAAVEHARTRKQFGRAIGSFQAVAHPLVDAALGLEATHKLVVTAARAVDEGRADASALAVAARLSASRTALDAAFTSHQTHGAIGYSVEGPVGHVAQRIRQLSLAPSHPERTGDRVTAMYSRKVPA